LLAAGGGACAPAQGAGTASYDVSPWSGGNPGWKLIDTTGKTWSASDTAGRAVLINFWASWCEPCRAEMPSLQELADLHGPRKLLVLAVNFKEPPARALRFAQTLGLRMPVLLDTDGAAARAWGVNIFPTTLTIDSRGKPRQRLRGEVDWSAPEPRQRVSSLFAG
ncbi:MAG: TlpA family protein disulfide reductase, partial [Polaromonas sp.]|nr:TlpA family protein disulfide reductase [Polaromonas sp.]